MRINSFIQAVVCAAFCGVACAQSPAGTPEQRLDQGMASLMRHYDAASGMWSTEGWWNDANSVSVVAEAASLEPGKYENVLAGTLKNGQTVHVGGHAIHPDFINKFYDDEGWWALAWIKAYDVTKEQKYLKAANVLFEDMTGGWDSTCGGGVWWSKDRKYKNAIPNELFLSVAAKLANRTEGKAREKYLEWAKREWAWFDASGMINGESLINDGLTSDCRNNKRTTWTYNQGVILGGLADLSQAEKNLQLLSRANAIALAAITKLTDDNGVLHDPVEPVCKGGDTVQFKGIFVRNLIELQMASPHDEYLKFLATNASAVWNQARLDGQGFSCSWSGPAEDRGAGATTSALAPLLGAAQFKLEAK